MITSCGEIRASLLAGWAWLRPAAGPPIRQWCCLRPKSRDVSSVFSPFLLLASLLLGRKQHSASSFFKRNPSSPNVRRLAIAIGRQMCLPRINPTRVPSLHARRNLRRACAPLSPKSRTAIGFVGACIEGGRAPTPEIGLSRMAVRPAGFCSEGERAPVWRNPA